MSGKGLPILRGPKMTHVFRSERKATAYAQKRANATGRAHGVYKDSPGRYTVKDVDGDKCR